MTDSERAEAYEDIYGRPPPHVARSKERLLALEREVKRLPESEREALTRALRKHPLLFTNCPHTKMFLEQNEGEFDAVAAAQRLAKYWKSRRTFFGDETCYTPGTFPVPVLGDYQRYYARNFAILNDTDADEMARDDARRAISIINDRKVEALDTYLRRIRELFDPEDSDDELTDEDHLEIEALAMALESPYELKLQFLHVENMMEQNAAPRMVRYFETGLRLFGRSFQNRRVVTLEDTEDCSVLFNAGMVRIMPSEDEFGRSVLVLGKVIAEEGEETRNHQVTEERFLQLGINEDHSAKVIWYMLHAAMERKTCRQNGIVFLADMREFNRQYFAKFSAHFQAGQDVVDCVPVKIRATHCLLRHNHPLWRVLLQALCSYFTVTLKRRVVVHARAQEDNIEKLGTTYGIKSDNLPVDAGGTVDADYFVRWLEDRGAAGA
uniref:CRAL-TRIO domain-containing protein n=1 Tax=Odontella aurita TaxID=265563 RepID=A0A7S4MVI1_9STRA